MDQKEAKGKRKRDLKFAQLPRSSIKRCADQAGYPAISEEIAALLAEDSNYRLTEIMFSACQFMRHSQRDKLTTEDVSKALKWADVPPVYGYKEVEPLSCLSFSNKKEFSNKKDKTSAQKEEYVDLLKLTKTVTEYEVLAIPSWQTEWLESGGFPNNNTNSEPFQPEIINFPRELQLYYDVMKTTILEADGEKLEVAMQDLKSNPNIGSLLPFLVTFLTSEICKARIGNNKRLCRMIMALDCLVSNKSLYFSYRLHSDMLISSLLQCFKVTEADVFTNLKKVYEPEEIREPFTYWHTSVDNWSLLELIADVLAKVDRKITSTTEISSSLSKYLNQILYSNTKPLVCQYAAIKVIMGFGPMGILELLYPFIKKNIVCLSRRLSINFTADNAFQQEALHRIYSALLSATVSLVKFIADGADPLQVTKFLMKFRKSSYDRLGLDMYREFYEYFGDAFTARLPCIECENIYRAHGLIPLFTNEETKTASKILEDFYSQDTSNHRSSDRSDTSPKKSSSSEKQNLWGIVPSEGSVLRLRKVDSPGPSESSQSPSNNTTPPTVAKKSRNTRKCISSKAVFYRKLLSGNINNIL